MKQLLPQSNQRQRLGKLGEDLATQYLIKNHYQVIGRNFKARYGELDIIAIKDNVLVFVEVKTRIGERFGKPEEAVTPWKLREVVKTAEYYKLTHDNLPDLMRIDVIGIELDEDDKVVYFRHLESVTS
jgi:putative endonuclease